MEIINDAVQAYVDAHCDPEPELLQKINRETNLKVNMPRMLSGHFQGRILSLFSKLIRPKRILEIGTFTGYATLALAEGLAEDGRIYTIDINEELEDRVRSYFSIAGLDDKIKYLIGNATELIPGLDETFDMIFIDADKRNNEVYYDLVFDKLNKGGIIIIDNVLWSGKVVDLNNDKDTLIIKSFNEKVTHDSRTEKLILPVRDGLFIVRKK